MYLYYLMDKFFNHVFDLYYLNLFLFNLMARFFSNGLCFSKEYWLISTSKDFTVLGIYTGSIGLSKYIR